MTTYKEIFGKQIQQLSTDPTSAEAEGQVWYNTTSGTFKTVTAVGAWSRGGALPQVVSYNSGAGTQTAALSIGGQEASTSAIQNTYEYDGSSWSDGGPVAPIYPGVSSYYGASCGTQTAALIVGGGSGTNATGEYNGSSWTATGNYPVTTFMGTANGIQTAAINIGGRVPPGSVATGIVANYNGSTWTASPVAISPAQYKNSSAGTSTATIVSGGITPSATVTTAQEWDGSSWTTVGAPSAPKSAAKSTGIQTLALKMYGTTGGTEQYNGSSWTTVANQAIARDWATGGGSNDSNGATGVMFGGKTSSGSPTFQSATEEFTTTAFSPIAATWSAEGNLPAPRFNGGQGIGIESAAAIFGGNVSSVSYPYTNSTNEYDGSSWTNGGNLNNTGANRGAFGTQTAGLSLGSYQYPPNVSTTNVEEYNGSAWTAKSAMGTSRYGAGGAGTSTAGLVIGGSTKPGATGGTTGSEEYNGSGWTAGGTMPNAVLYLASGGTQTAAIRAGGTRSGAPRLDETFEYDGSSWTAGGTMGTARYLCNGSGGPTAQTAMLIAGGQTATATTGVSEVYNGTAWATTTSLGTARNQHMNAQFNNANNALVAGGIPPSSGLSSSERFTSEVVQLGYKTLTSS